MLEIVIRVLIRYLLLGYLDPVSVETTKFQQDRPPTQAREGKPARIILHPCPNFLTCTVPQSMTTIPDTEAIDTLQLGTLTLRVRLDQHNQGT